MKFHLLVIFSAVVLTAADVKLEDDYHIKIGIPFATWLKQAEEQSLAVKNARIVGGAIAPTNAYPYLAGLIISFFNHWTNSACGASLISQNRLVTAAHCWRHSLQASQFEVVLGSRWLYHGGTRITTSHVIEHPQYVPSTLTNDVAIIYLPWSVATTSSIRPVSLPHNNLWDTFVGQWAMAAGYGKTADSQTAAAGEVSHVTLNVISEAQCRVSFGAIVQWSTLCTSGVGNVGICGGDSGGPLVIQRNGEDILIGISSFVATAGCQLSHPSGFARVTSFYSFITQHL